MLPALAAQLYFVTVVRPHYPALFARVPLGPLSTTFRLGIAVAALAACVVGAKALWWPSARANAVVRSAAQVSLVLGALIIVCEQLANSSIFSFAEWFYYSTPRVLFLLMLCHGGLLVWSVWRRHLAQTPKQLALAAVLTPGVVFVGEAVLSEHFRTCGLFLKSPSPPPEWPALLLASASSGPLVAGLAIAQRSRSLLARA